jgi:hypothetical protein
MQIKERLKNHMHLMKALYVVSFNFMVLSKIIVDVEMYVMMMRWNSKCHRPCK